MCLKNVTVVLNVLVFKIIYHKTQKITIQSNRKSLA